MIKILKEGNLVTTTCENCGCVFQFDKKEDVKVENINSCNRFSATRECIKCPQCDEEIVLSSTR